MKRERGVKKKKRKKMEEKGKGKERTNAMADLLYTVERIRTEAKNVPLPGFERHSSIRRGTREKRGGGTEDRDESLAAFEKDPETAINYRLISHNYRANQTRGMPRHRVSTQVRRNNFN